MRAIDIAIGLSEYAEREIEGTDEIFENGKIEVEANGMPVLVPVWMRVDYYEYEIDPGSYFCPAHIGATVDVEIEVTGDAVWEDDWGRDHHVPAEAINLMLKRNKLDRYSYED